MTLCVPKNPLTMTEIGDVFVTSIFFIKYLREKCRFQTKITILQRFHELCNNPKLLSEVLKVKTALIIKISLVFKFL